VPYSEIKTYITQATVFFLLLPKLCQCHGLKRWQWKKLLANIGWASDVMMMDKWFLVHKNSMLFM
jgi:hypothetical protein